MCFQKCEILHSRYETCIYVNVRVSVLSVMCEMHIAKLAQLSSSTSALICLCAARISAGVTARTCRFTAMCIWICIYSPLKVQSYSSVTILVNTVLFVANCYLELIEERKSASGAALPFQSTADSSVHDNGYSMTLHVQGKCRPRSLKKTQYSPHKHTWQQNRRVPAVTICRTFTLRNVCAV